MAVKGSNSQIYAVEISGLNYSYLGQEALHEINLKVKNNKFLSIIGPNGGGKTTLLKIILGMLSPQSGSVKVFSKVPAEAREEIGYVPQINNFNRDIPATAFEVVISSLAASKAPFASYAQKEKDAAHEAIKQVGMREFEQKQMSELSGGQVQRILMARALVRNPRLLLLDEPVSSVDMKMQKSIYSLLRELKSKMAIIMVTHDVAATSSYVDEVACLNVKLHHHGDIKGGIEALSKISSCPVEILAHGIPHRVLGEHGA